MTVSLSGSESAYPGRATDGTEQPSAIDAAKINESLRSEGLVHLMVHSPFVELYLL